MPGAKLNLRKTYIPTKRGFFTRFELDKNLTTVYDLHQKSIF